MESTSAAGRRLARASPIFGLLVALAVATTGCASGRGLSGDPSSYGAASARTAAETFLEAARERDYTVMGRHFGTRQGPAERRLGLGEVEQRMIVLAGLLHHETSSLRREDLAQLGPHRTRFVAILAGTREGRVSVPLVTVTTADGRWFVERIGVEALSRSAAGRRGPPGGLPGGRPAGP